MSRLRWELARLFSSLGLPGWVGLALLVGCAGFWAGAAQPLMEQTLRLGDESAELRQRLAKAPVAAPEVDGPREQLDRFGKRFSGEQGIAPSLRRLHTLARSHGVSIQQAEFKYVNDAAEPLARYTIVLPVSAEYPALRRFSRALLRELPGLALEEVNLRRSDATTNRLEAQLQLVLFLTKTP